MTASPLRADRDDLQAFLALFRDANPESWISLRVFPDGGHGGPPLHVKAIRVDDPQLLDLAYTYACEAANSPEPSVFAPPLSTFSSSERAREQDLVNGLALSVECDSSPQEARARLTALLGEPTFIVESGGLWIDPETGELQPKVHVHWRLTAPTVDPKGHVGLRALRKYACNYVAADATAVALVHPMRWPGSWHRKATPRLARIVARSNATIDLETALEVFRAIPAEEYKRPMDIGVAKANPDKMADLGDVVAALEVLPNDSDDWNDWLRVGLATWAASGGDVTGFEAFDAWSSRHPKYNATNTEDRWSHITGHPPSYIGFGSLVHLVRQVVPGWVKPTKVFRPEDWFEDVDADALSSSTSTPAEEDHAFKLNWHGDPDTSPLKEWLVSKLLPKIGTAILAGQWGLYKTFTGFDLTAAVITGGAFANRAVERRGGVLWIAVEGQDEVRVRLAAVVNEKVRPAIEAGCSDTRLDAARLPFVWIEECPKLSGPNAYEQLEAVISAAVRGLHERFGVPLVLTVIDTFSPAAELKDANDTAENQRVQNVLKRLARHFEMLVLQVDHFGKDVTTGTRNSSVKEADADAVLALLGERDLAGNVTDARLAVRKIRGAATGQEIRFDTKLTYVADDAGEIHSTLTIDWASGSGHDQPHASQSGPTWHGTSHTLKTALERAIAKQASGCQPASGAWIDGSVRKTAVRQEFDLTCPGTKETKRRTFNRLLRKAEDDGLVEISELHGVPFVGFARDKGGTTGTGTKDFQSFVPVVPL